LKVLWKDETIQATGYERLGHKSPPEAGFVRDRRTNDSTTTDRAAPAAEDHRHAPSQRMNSQDPRKPTTIGVRGSATTRDAGTKSVGSNAHGVRGTTRARDEDEQWGDEWRGREQKGRCRSSASKRESREGGRASGRATAEYSHNRSNRATYRRKNHGKLTTHNEGGTGEHLQRW
jgi:hypothetical protein